MIGTVCRSCSFAGLVPSSAVCLASCRKVATATAVYCHGETVTGGLLISARSVESSSVLKDNLIGHETSSFRPIPNTAIWCSGSPSCLFSALPRKLVFLHHLGRTFRGLIVVSNITTRLAQLLLDHTGSNEMVDVRVQHCTARPAAGVRKAMHGYE